MNNSKKWEKNQWIMNIRLSEFLLFWWTFKIIFILAATQKSAKASFRQHLAKLDINPNNASKRLIE